MFTVTWSHLFQKKKIIFRQILLLLCMWQLERGHSPLYPIFLFFNLVTDSKAIKQVAANYQSQFSWTFPTCLQLWLPPNQVKNQNILANCKWWFPIWILHALHTGIQQQTWKVVPSELCPHSSAEPSLLGALVYASRVGGVHWKRIRYSFLTHEKPFRGKQLHLWSKPGHNACPWTGPTIIILRKQ